MSSEVSSGCSVRSRPTSQTSTDTLTCDDLPMAADAPDMPPPATIPSSSGTSSIGPYHHPHPHHHHHQHHHHHHHLHHSHNPHLGRRARTPRHLHPPLRTSDLPRESPALESPIEPFLDSEFVSECDACDPVEHHSSEEELETLTGSWPRETGPPEKRKWSQVARVSLTDSGELFPHSYILAVEYQENSNCLSSWCMLIMSRWLHLRIQYESYRIGGQKWCIL